MKKKKVYFIGIAGKAMAPLAKAFQDKGWLVSGSDHRGIYPPMSDYLKENNLFYKEGYEEKNLPLDADLVIVGRSALLVDPANPEYRKALSFKIPVLSYPEAIKRYLIKKESIVIAGTYGKTTITALISWILTKAGKDPSFMIGGQPLNFTDGVRFGKSDFSVVEGDETPDLLPTDPSKFLFYQPKYLLLTSSRWDHPEIFSSKKEYLDAYLRLVKLLPKDGKIIYNLDNVDESIIKQTKCEKNSYSFNNPKADWFITGFVKKSASVSLEFNNLLKVETLLLGKANRENITGAAALCSAVGISQETIALGIKTFLGVKTRLEFLGKFSDKYFYWDFAQHPEKVKGSLEALKDHYAESRLICIFDPSASIFKYPESLKWVSGAFSAADVILINRVAFTKENKGENRVKGPDLVKAIRLGNQNIREVIYCPLETQINDYLQNKIQKNDVIVFMSSGGLAFTKLIQKNIDYFKQEAKL